VTGWVAPIVALLWWSMTAPEFSIRSIEILGDATQSRGWVTSQLGQFTDRNLLLLELDDVRARLRRHPWVAQVQVRKELPDRLRVTISEHLPRGVLVAMDEEFLVTADGLVFSRLKTAEERLSVLAATGEGMTTASGDPLLEIRFGTPLAVAGVSQAEELIGRRLPRVAALFTTLEDFTRGSAAWRQPPVLARVLGGGDFEFEYEEGTPGMLISATSATERAVLLERLRPQIDQRYVVAAFDLRFRDRIVLRGAKAIERETLDITQSELGVLDNDKDRSAPQIGMSAGQRMTSVPVVRKWGVRELGVRDLAARDLGLEQSGRGPSGAGRSEAPGI
jgi:hypothetical protein